MPTGRRRAGADQLEEGDFVLLPATPAFTMSSFEPATPRRIDPKVTPAATDEVRHGRPTVPAGCAAARRLLRVRLARCGTAGFALAGTASPAWHRTAFGAGAACWRGGERTEPGRDLVLARLVEVLLIEALRAARGRMRRRGCCAAWPMRAVPRRCGRCTAIPSGSWTVAELAREAGMSRSAFFDRFTRTVGLPPMEYLLAWRMAVAKDLLRSQTSRRRSCRARGLWLGQHIQHRVQSPCGSVAGPLCARAPGGSGHSTARDATDSAGIVVYRSRFTGGGARRSRHEAQKYLGLHVTLADPWRDCRPERV